MREIIVRFPKPMAILGMVVWLPMFAFFAIVGTLMTLFMHTLADKMPMWGLAGGYLIFPVMVWVSVAYLFVFFLYARETFFTTFRITEDGINIENRRYGSLILSWPDIEAARYNKNLKILVLESRKLKAPIALIDDARRESVGFHAAVVQIRKNVGARWVATWLWP